jgi:hypothetical protein
MSPLFSPYYFRRPYYHYNQAFNQPIAPPVEPKKEEKKAPFLDLMGLSLEFDDVLIIGVLLFLFFEGVDDIMLYIILVLLLIG